jgi:hypothetical protein
MPHDCPIHTACSTGPRSGTKPGAPRQGARTQCSGLDIPDESTIGLSLLEHYDARTHMGDTSAPALSAIIIPVVVFIMQSTNVHQKLKHTPEFDRLPFGLADGRWK